jgi:hypothetical protein
MAVKFSHSLASEAVCFSFGILILSSITRILLLLNEKSANFKERTIENKQVTITLLLDGSKCDH